MELNLSQFITRLFAAAQAAGIAPAEAACSQSDSFNTRVRRSELGIDQGRPDRDQQVGKDTHAPGKHD